MKTPTLLLSIFISTYLAGGAVAQAETSTSKNDLKVSSAKYHNKISENTVLEFAQGQSSLSLLDQQKLSDLVKTAKAKGEITKIEMAVWSDKELPIKGDLSKADIKLANQRAEHIKEILKKDFGHTRHVRIFNMAEGSHWVASVFHTSEAELDSAFGKRGKDTIKREDFQIIKNEGAPSKAVVIMVVKE